MESSSACEVGFGAEAAAEFDQGLAVVVAMAVEGAIDPALNAALEGIEDGGRDEDGDAPGPTRALLAAWRCAPRRK